MFWHGIKNKPNKKRLLYNKHRMHVCITKRVTLKSSLYVKCKFSSVQVQNVENVEGEFRGLVYTALIMYLFPFCFCAFGYNRIFSKTVLVIFQLPQQIQSKVKTFSPYPVDLFLFDPYPVDLFKFDPRCISERLILKYKEKTQPYAIQIICLCVVS